MIHTLGEAWPQQGRVEIGPDDPGYDELMRGLSPSEETLERIRREERASALAALRLHDVLIG
jgi:hypothetical protein